MSAQEMTKEQKEAAYESAFTAFDADNSDTMSTEEFMRVLETVKSKFSVSDAKSLIRNMTYGQKVRDQINLKQFKSIMRWQLEKEDALLVLMACEMEKFKGEDKDTNNVLSKEEGMKLLAKFSPNKSPEELEELFKKTDSDSDGQISKTEFLKFFGSIAAEYANKPTEEKLTKEEKDALAAYESAFIAFDTDSNGTMSKDEFKRVLETLKNDFRDSDIDIIFSSMDKDGIKDLSLKEFKSAMETYISKADNLLVMMACEMEKFKEVDKDGNNVLSKGEAMQLLGKFSPEKSPEELEEVFKQTDANSDGQISTKEFLKYFGTIAPTIAAKKVDKATE